MKQLSNLIFFIAIVLLASCDSSSSTSMSGTWKRTTPEFEFTYTFTSSGYDQRTKYEIFGKTYDELTDNGSYILQNGDITLYSGMGSGIITGTVSGKNLTIRGNTYTKQ